VEVGSNRFGGRFAQKRHPQSYRITVSATLPDGTTSTATNAVVADTSKWPVIGLVETKSTDRGDSAAHVDSRS
jgi:hypothetical protein